MKLEDVNDNTIKISLTFEDLTEHDVKISDFFSNQEVIEQLFYELVDELGLEERFNNTGLLTFQVQPFSKGIHLIVSEETAEGLDFDENGIPEDPEEFEKLMTGFYDKLNEIGENMAAERGMKDFKPGLGLPGKKSRKKEPEPDYVNYSIHYDDISLALLAVKNIQFDDEASEFYRYEGEFYIVVLDNQKKRGKMHVESTRARMMEYGEETKLSREFLQEHGECLIATRALDVLRKI
ncbi:adaptor protein MecA [Lactococcus nasutitermitis]|uniref:Adaptor protein MecA n=1 Tax=Lactococcus nasutitermitis TaxID=1652957 RepID=A0ABV9JAZ9_9LACT|nr:adaptor protein MecA [Lactococcus nasutitermitis]